MSKFKELRMATGMTQEEFRNKFNGQFNRTYTAAAISQFENGKRTPEISALIDFADFFKVSLDYLLDRKTPQKKSAPTFNEDEMRLIVNYRTLDERGKNFVREAVENNQARVNRAFHSSTYIRPDVNTVVNATA